MSYINFCLCCDYSVCWPLFLIIILSSLLCTFRMKLLKQLHCSLTVFKSRPHLIFCTFLSLPRPLVAKLSGSQLQWFVILFLETSGYYHPLVLLNAISKLTSFPFQASHVPHLATPAPLTQACLNLCAV